MPSLLYAKLLRAKLCLFVFGAIFAALHWQFISICICFMWLVLANFQGLVVQIRGQGAQILKVVGSILPQQKFEYLKAHCYVFSSMHILSIQSV